LNVARYRLPAHVINGVSVALGIGVIQALLHAAAGPRAAALAMTGAIYCSLADLPVRPERNWRRVGAAALMGLAAATLMLLLKPTRTSSASASRRSSSSRR